MTDSLKIKQNIKVRLFKARFKQEKCYRVLLKGTEKLFSLKDCCCNT